MNDILKGLNKQQLEAAKHIDGPLLILAGAGSGKTLTITTRLAYLLSLGIPATNILTLTFTNKAAANMRQKALAKIDDESQRPLLCTFHKFGLLFLRMYIYKLGLASNFNIIDSDDRKRLIKELNTDPKISNLAALNFISTYKNEGLEPKELEKELNSNLDLKYLKLFYLYEQSLRRQNLLDFDDLLLLPFKILASDEAFAKKCSKQYEYIMIDEYQDTNTLQYKLVKLLCSAHENICVVGDDDQSIYSFRGAKIENILNFKEQFKDVKLIKLEQNYRSVEVILDLANKLIQHNSSRLGKKLICSKERGENARFLSFDDEKQEAASVALEIKALINKGENPNEIAIFYRINALSRALEEALMREKIAFSLLSGVRFYEREEIKDIVAYLRLVCNENDDLSLIRVLNKPKRSIGKSSLDKLKDKARSINQSLFKTLEIHPEIIASAKGKKGLFEFLELIYTLKQTKDLKELITSFESLAKLKSYYEQRPDGVDKVANIDEFYASFKDKADDFESLQDLLNEISLLSNMDELNQACVYLMSIHAAKGLEFDNVFITGLEEGFFPITMEDTNLQEERRLAYVAITRAKKRIFLSQADSRFFRGNRTALKPSRFLSELRDEKPCFEPIKVGSLIRHKIFGIGRVQKIQNDRLHINFQGLVRVIMTQFVDQI